MILCVDKTIKLRTEVKSFDEVTLPKVEEKGWGFVANFKFGGTAHTVQMFGNLCKLSRKTKPERVLDTVLFDVYEEPNALNAENPTLVMRIFIVKELFPKRIYFQSGSCGKCFDAYDKDQRLQLISRPEYARTCLRSELTVNGSHVEAFDIHKSCNRDGQREFIMHLIDTVGMLYNKVIEIEDNGGDEKVVPFYELYNYIKRINEPRESNKEVKKEEPEYLIPAEYAADYYLQDSGDGKYILNFKYNDKSYHRSRKCTEKTAKRLLYNIYDYVVNHAEATNTTKNILSTIQVSVDMEALYKEENEDLRAQLTALRKERDELKEQLYNATQKQNVAQPVLAYGDVSLSAPVQELFTGEVKYQILSALKKYQSVFLTDKHRVTRHSEVIQSILGSNQVNDLRENMKELLSANITALQDNPSKVLSMLQQCGLTAEKNGQGHWFVYPVDHKEYGVSLSSTPGDYRTRRNEIARLLNVLF